MRSALAFLLALAACEQSPFDARRSDDVTSLPPFRLPAGPPRLVVRGDQACVVRPDATARCWGREGVPSPLVDRDVLQVSLGDRRLCLLHRGGRVACRSSLTDSMPERATPSVSSLSDVVQLAGRERQTCALRHDGSVSCWVDGTPVAVRGLPPIRKLAASGRHTCALAREGSVFCWGNGAAGALGDGGTHDRGAPVRAKGVSGAIDLAVTDEASCALSANGALRCWGSGLVAAGPGAPTSPEPHAVATLEHAMGIALGTDRLCALRQGGTVACGTPPGGVERIQGLTNIEELGLDEHLSCALAQGGAVFCWSGDAPPRRIGEPREQGGTGAGSG